VTKDIQPEIQNEIDQIRENMSSEIKSNAPKAAPRLSGLNKFLAGWSIISAIVLSVIAWNFLQTSVYDAGLKSGAQSAAAQIYTDMINKAANDKCNTVFVQYENRRVDLINVRCLPSNSGENGQENVKAVGTASDSATKPVTPSLKN